MRYLGIDASTKSTGIAVFDEDKLVAHDCLKASSTDVIKRIANHYGIMVSFVDPKFTSKQCLVCGNIDNENRLNQETFKCTKHDFISNADLNAACNIKNRIAIFKDKLTFKFDKDFNGFKQSKYNSKNDYLEMYKNFDKMLIMDQIWKVFKL